MSQPLPKLDEQTGGWSIALASHPDSLSHGELEDMASRLHVRRVDLERALAKQQADWLAAPAAIEALTTEIAALDQRIQKVRDRLVPMQRSMHT